MRRYCTRLSQCVCPPAKRASCDWYVLYAADEQTGAPASAVPDNALFDDIKRAIAAVLLYAVRTDAGAVTAAVLHAIRKRYNIPDDETVHDRLMPTWQAHDTLSAMAEFGIKDATQLRAALTGARNLAAVRRPDDWSGY